MSHTVLVIPEGVDSSDGRSYPPGSLTWRETVPLQFTDETTEHHEGAFHVGNLFNLRRQTIAGATWIVAELTFDNDEDAAEAMRLADELKIAGVSADVAQVWEASDELDAEGFPIFNLVSAEIVGVTQVPMPAFDGARILSVSETVELVPPLITASMVAAAFSQLTEWKPPRHMFEVPEPEESTPITVYEEDGFVGFYGHAARDWNQCHIGLPGCVTPPVSPSDGEEFNTRSLELDDGSVTLVGPVTMSTTDLGGHADLEASIGDTKSHYDNANSVIAVGRMSNGAIAPWVCGAVLPDVTPSQLTRFKLQQLSGDWRRHNGELEMFACLAVPIGGFGVKARVASGHVQALIATGPPPEEDKSDLTLVYEALSVMGSKLDALLGPEDEDEDDEVHGDYPPMGRLAAVLEFTRLD